MADDAILLKAVSTSVGQAAVAPVRVGGGGHRRATLARWCSWPGVDDRGSTPCGTSCVWMLLRQTPPTTELAVPQVTLLYFDRCPSWQFADQHLRELADELDLTISREKVDTPEAAERRAFRGSPTMLVDGEDGFATGDEPVGLSCRIYETADGPAGGPTVDQLRAVLA